MFLELGCNVYVDVKFFCKLAQCYYTEKRQLLMVLIEVIFLL